MASITTDGIRQEIQVILKGADLNALSSKKVRQMLEEKFQCDLTQRKKEIDDILMAEITTADLIPISPNLQPIEIDTKLSDDKSQIQLQINTNGTNISTLPSNPILYTESSQEEYRSSIRQSICSTTSTTPASGSKPAATGTTFVFRRRKTCYNKEMDLSDQLAVVVGGHRMPRSEVVKRMWVYFREHKLMDPINRQFINCDETLGKIFGRKRIRAFGMLKGLARHMSDPDKQ